MANNNTLKSDIRQYIYSNQNEEITGNILRDVLLEMVDTLGDGWTYKGVATTTTNPGTPDDNVFYIATAPGTYTNFGGLSVVDGEVAILKYNGSWAKDVTGAATSAQVTQLGQEVTDLENAVDGYNKTQEETIPQTLTANKSYNLSSTLPTKTNNLADCYCSKIEVTPGENYRISGFRNNSTTSRLFATFASDGTRKRYAITSSSGLRNTEELTIASDEAWLCVNLKSYDTELGDGFWRVTQQTIHHKGLEERVADLEDNTITIVDNLESTSATDSLSANQGRILNEDINGVTTEHYIEQEIITQKVFNTASARVPSKENLADATLAAVCYLYVNPGEQYRIYGMGNTNNAHLYVFAQSDRTVTFVSEKLNTRSSGLEITIPEGVAILLVNLLEYDNNIDKVEKIEYVTTECVKTRLAAIEENEVIIGGYAQPLKGKQVVFFGDSITEFTLDGKGVVSYFQDASGCVCHKAAIGGSRWAERGTPTLTPTTEAEARAALDTCNLVKAWAENDFTYQDAAVDWLKNNTSYDYTARIDELKSIPVGNAQIVMIGGGSDYASGIPFGNEDDLTHTTIYGAINSIMTDLLTANPALKIYIYSSCVSYRADIEDNEHWSDNYVFPTYNLTKPQIYERYSEHYRKKWHTPYIDLYWSLGWNQTNYHNYFYVDNSHPYKGFDVIGKRLYQQVLVNIE